jgi:hypothetical protein
MSDKKDRVHTLSFFTFIVTALHFRKAITCAFPGKVPEESAMPPHNLL